MNKNKEATTNNQTPDAFFAASFALFRAFCVSDESDECTLPIAFNGYHLSVVIESTNDEIRFGLGLQRNVSLFAANAFAKELKKLFGQKDFALTRSEQFAKTYWFTADKKMLVVLLQALQEFIYVSLQSNHKLSKFTIYPDSKEIRDKIINLHVSIGEFVKINRFEVDSLFNLTTQFIVARLKSDPQFKHQIEPNLYALSNDLKEKYNRHSLDQPLILFQSQKIVQKTELTQNQQLDKPCFCLLT